MLKRSPSSFTPCLDGRYLLLGPDKELNYSEISKFSKRDAEAYPRSAIASCIFLGEVFVFFIFLFYEMVNQKMERLVLE